MKIKVEQALWPNTAYFFSWGGQSWPQPPFRRLDQLESWSAGRIARPTSVSDLLSGESRLEKVCGIERFRLSGTRPRSGAYWSGAAR
jgi:hypothetical protein